MHKHANAVLALALSCVLAQRADAGEALPSPSSQAAIRTMAALSIMHRSLLVQPDLDLLVLTASEAIRKSAADLPAFDACTTSAVLPDSPKPKCPANYTPIRLGFHCLADAKMTPDQLDAAGDQAVFAAMTRFDPAGKWLTAADFERLLKPEAGVGITLKKTTSGPLVVSVPANAPGYIGGVRRGDHIVAIDGKPVGNGPLEPVIAAIRGTKGSQLTLQVRHTDNTVADLVLTRGDVILEDRWVEIDRQGPILRLAVLQMSGGIVQQVRAALAAQSEPVGLLVLDLRYNSGGLLDESISLADIFLGKADIATVIERQSNYNETYRSNREQVLNGVPMVVWTDPVTASGAEIVASALQDNQRARVIGQTTFGLGRIQTLIPTDRNHALKLTTGQVLRANGKVLADTHVKPDCPADPERLSLGAMLALLTPTPTAPCPDLPQPAPVK